MSSIPGSVGYISYPIFIDLQLLGSLQGSLGTDILIQKLFKKTTKKQKEMLWLKKILKDFICPLVCEVLNKSEVDGGCKVEALQLTVAAARSQVTIVKH